MLNEYFEEKTLKPYFQCSKSKSCSTTFNNYSDILFIVYNMGFIIKVRQHLRGYEADLKKI